MEEKQVDEPDVGRGEYGGEEEQEDAQQLSPRKKLKSQTSKTSTQMKCNIPQPRDIRSYTTFLVLAIILKFPKV